MTITDKEFYEILKEEYKDEEKAREIYKQMLIDRTFHTRNKRR